METKRIPTPKFFDVPAGARPAECRSCKATIYWITTVNDKKMPVDCEVVGGHEPTASASGSGVSHFATCTEADQHRRPR